MYEPISEQLKTRHQEYMRKRPLNQVAAIKQYINGSSYINQLLRDGFNVGNPEHCKFFGLEMTQRVKNMDACLGSDELAFINEGRAPFVVYRGINSATLGAAIEKFGYIHHPHYMSTSSLPNVASNAFAGAGCCVFRIIVDPSDPKCPSFVYISHSESSESEILFERGTYLNLLQKGESNGQNYYLVEASKEARPSNNASSMNSSNTNVQLSDTEVLITRDEVEDELAFLSEEQMQNDETAIAAISESLQQVFRSIPAEKVHKHVSVLYKQIKKDQQVGGAKGKKRTTKVGK